MTYSKQLGAVVFDLDGTLVESAPDLRHALNHALAAAGREPVSLDAVRGMIGDGIAMLVQRGFEATGGLPDGGDITASIDDCLRYYGAHTDDNSHLYPGVEQTLRALRDAGHVLAVCTNKPEGPAVDLLRALGVHSLFDAVVGADTFDFKKPDPRVLPATVARLGRDAARSVMVGDSRNDALVAHGAGVPFVLVSFGYLNASIEELNPALTIDALSELPGQLGRL